MSDMSDMVQNFIMARFPIAGMAAYSVHSSDQVLQSQSLSRSLYAATTEQMLASVVKNGLALLPPGGRPAHYCWTFEAHQVFVAVRTDGLALALLMENNVSVQLSSVKNLLQSFLELQEAEA
jgi:hypothetical protein